MATLTIGITSGVVTGSKTYTLSDADVSRLIAAYRDALHMPEETNAQVLAAWADHIVDNTKRMVKTIEGKSLQPADISIT